MRSSLSANMTQKLSTDSDVLGSNSTTNPYINNDSIAVRLWAVELSHTKFRDFNLVVHVDTIKFKRNSVTYFMNNFSVEFCVYFILIS